VDLLARDSMVVVCDDVPKEKVADLERMDSLCVYYSVFPISPF
jgi:hypothetical protein